MRQKPRNYSTYFQCNFSPVIGCFPALFPIPTQHSLIFDLLFNPHHLAASTVDGKIYPVSIQHTSLPFGTGAGGIFSTFSLDH